jgi:hypothetical protein
MRLISFLYVNNFCNAYYRNILMNFLEQVPYTLERMINYGMFICTDSFLFNFTALPIRAVIALYHLLIRRRQLHSIQKVDILKLLLLILGFMALRLLDIPSLSTFMAKESLLKIKYLATLVAVMDRLMSSYGTNILGSLFWAVNQPPHKVKRGYYWHFILSIIYISIFQFSIFNSKYKIGITFCSIWHISEKRAHNILGNIGISFNYYFHITVIHSSIMLAYIAVMDVAMEGKNTALLTLLILIQFAEMKSAVLKDMAKDKLYAICYNDILERFQLSIVVVLLFFYNISKHHVDTFWVSFPILMIFIFMFSIIRMRICLKVVSGCGLFYSLSLLSICPRCLLTG